MFIASSQPHYQTSSNNIIIQQVIDVNIIDFYYSKFCEFCKVVRTRQRSTPLVMTQPAFIPGK
jgi:hypothetical protein